MLREIHLSDGGTGALVILHLTEKNSQETPSGKAGMPTDILK
jgi:hypothetical protein